jgi:regulator of replication initiation timing
MGTAAKAEQDGLTSVLETLVNDNEVLKRDNAELQRLLAESREDHHAMQEELEEQRANMYPIPRSGRESTQFRYRAPSDFFCSPYTSN